MPGSPEQKPDLEISASTAARILGVSIAQVYRYAESGDLRFRDTLPKAKRAGRKKHTYRFMRSQVEALRDRQRR